MIESSFKGYISGCVFTKVICFECPLSPKISGPWLQKSLQSWWAAAMGLSSELRKTQTTLNDESEINMRIPSYWDRGDQNQLPWILNGEGESQKISSREELLGKKNRESILFGTGCMIWTSLIISSTKSAVNSTSLSKVVIWGSSLKEL